MAQHEIRDPIHNFIRILDHERDVVDSLCFQRLRQIHQLALTYLVYPGATHRRFEHSLGVMELATRIFDSVTKAEKLQAYPQVMDVVPKGDKLAYWRQVLRVAALLHDVGHLPFSHAGEDLLPAGWKHERLTAAIVLDPSMAELWSEMTPPLRPQDIVKIAVGPRVIAKIPEFAKDPKYQFNSWDAILADMIVADVFGADRMDYLLRDSHHAGVAYGKFDHYRLIDTLRILPARYAGEGASEPELGVESGGLQAAESLLWARYLMYSQVYFHHVRRIYDIHLRDFLKGWLPNGFFSTDVEKHLELTDTEIVAGMTAVMAEKEHPAYTAAEAILKRKHFRRVYSRNPADQTVTPDAGRAVLDGLVKEFGEDKIRYSQYEGKATNIEFPVEQFEGIESSMTASEAIGSVPPVAIFNIYAAPDVRSEARQYLKNNQRRLVEDGLPTQEEVDDA